jgi:hypothetical protein
MTTETSPAGGVNPAASQVPASTAAGATPASAPGEAAAAQPGAQANPPAGEESSPGAAAAGNDGQQGDGVTSEQDPEGKRPRQTSEERKAQIRAEIGRLTAERRAEEARLRAVRQERARLERPIRPANLDELPYDQREQVTVREAVRAEQVDRLRSEEAVAAQSAAAKRYEQFAAKIEEAGDRFPGLLEQFEAEDGAGNARVPLSHFAADFIVDSDRTVELTHYLVSNPQVAVRLNRLPATQQAVELARLEARLTPAPALRKPSNAPAPPATLNGGASPAAVDPNAMDYATYRKWANEQDAAKNRR